MKFLHPLKKHLQCRRWKTYTARSARNEEQGQQWQRKKVLNRLRRLFLCSLKVKKHLKNLRRNILPKKYRQQKRRLQEQEILLRSRFPMMLIKEKLYVNLHIKTVLWPQKPQKKKNPYIADIMNFPKVLIKLPTTEFLQ